MYFSFGNWANVIWVLNMKPLILLFQGRTVPLLLIPSVILHLFFVLFSLYGRFYVPIPCGESRLCTSIMFSKFVFYLFLSIWPETRRQPLRYDGLRRFTLLPCSSGFSLSPFQAYSSQYLPVLSKCYCKVFQWDDSKYVYINRGNTLGYILLTPCVAWCLSCLLVYDVCRWLEKPALDLTWKTSINQLKNKSFLLIITAELAR